MFDLTGSKFNFSVAENVRETICISFKIANSETSFDLSDATFQARAFGKENSSTVTLSVEHGNDKGDILITIPPLENDSYTYEIYATDPDGDISRLLYGSLYTVSTQYAKELQDNAEQEVLRTLVANIPPQTSYPLELRWKSSSAASRNLAQAEEMKEGFAEMIDEATENIQEATSSFKEEIEALTERAETAANNALKSEEVAKDAAEELNTINATLALFDEKVRSAIIANPETNTWWIGGYNTGTRVTGEAGKSPRLSSALTWEVYNNDTQEWEDTGVCAKGEDGKSPYINSAGNWVTWNAINSVWEDTGLPAAGKDGRDGNTVRRIIVSTEEDIPKSGETCNGGYYYYVPWSGNWNIQCSDVKDATEKIFEFYKGIRLDLEDGEIPEGKLYAIRLNVEMTKDFKEDPCYLGIWEYNEETEALELKAVSDNAFDSFGGTVTTKYWKGIFEWTFSDGYDLSNPSLMLNIIRSSSMENLAYDNDVMSFGGYLLGNEVTSESGTTANIFSEYAENGFRSYVQLLMRSEEEEDHTGEYNIYAWLEDINGQGNWEKVGLSAEFATEEIAGISRLGTDVRSNNGAPVAVNDDYQLNVPLPDYTTPGAAKLSHPEVLTAGAEIGVNEQGALYTRPTSYNTYGSAKTSFSSQVETSCIGLNANDQISVAWATLTQAGVVRLGSQFGQSNPIPYQQGVGVDVNHKLTNNLVYGGALQHKKPEAWSANNMQWLNTYMSYSPEYFDDMFYMGLLTSPQFTQSQAQGLTLLSATTDMLGGVYLAENMEEDDRPNASPSPSQIKKWVQNYAYSKSETYTRGETETLDSATLDKAKAYTNAQLQPYITEADIKTWAQDTFYSKTQADALFPTFAWANNKLKGKVATIDGACLGLVISEEAYSNLKIIRDDVFYLIV